MDALMLGLSVGLAAGVSPGPLLVLVITSTLRSGWRAGTAAACGPLVTDALIIAVVLVILDRLSDTALSVLGVVGALVVVWMGVSTIRDAQTATLERGEAGRSRAVAGALYRAAAVNVLSPHPWVAWATVLGPMTISAWRSGPGGAVALVVGFYLTLVGAKVAIAGLVAGGRRYLSDTGYRRTLVGAGALLIVAAVALAVEFVPRLFGA